MNNIKDENGYILVVVIGILTILSLLTITFATLSRIETRATRNYTDSVKCEMVAKAGLEHAIYELRLDKFGTDTLAYNDDDNDNYGLDENFDSSGTSWPGNSVFPDTGTDDYDNDGNGADDSTWIYFPATTSSLDIRLPGKLRARYAVLITDDREARVNINVTGNKAGSASAHTSNEGWSTFEIDLSNIIEQAATGKGTTIADTIINTRHGSDNVPGTSTVSEDSRIVPDPLFDGIDNDGDWDPLAIPSHDLNSNGIPDSGETNVDEANEATDEPNEFNSIFPYDDDIPFGILSEAEIMGTSSYDSRLEAIFNINSISEIQQDSLNNWLTTYSADTIVCPPYSLDGGTAITMLNINALISNEGAYDDNEDYYDSDKKAQMLVEAFTAGGVPDVERQQMAVNIIDFIDSDDTVTIYNDGTNDYYGIERTPYINEVEAQVDAGTSSGNGKFIELFNPYDTSLSIANWTISFGATTIIIDGPEIGTQTYYVIADNAQAYETDFLYESGIAADQYDVKVNDLATGGEYITLKDQNGITVQYTNCGGTTEGKSMQLNDPRPTPLTNDKGGIDVDPGNPWRWSDESTITAGNNNINLDPKKGADGWDDSPLTYWDSFLIANRRFSNKGYLGFIHNGRQWSSFKFDGPNNDVFGYITVTDPSMDGIDNDGDGKTDSDDTGSQTGDFDGPEYRIPGLINVNTASVEVLASLPDGSGGTLGDTTIATLIFNGNKPYSSIGDLVVKVTDITDTGATKWDKEKPLRSISNLITTRSNVFTVYVTAQIMKEDLSEKYAEKRILAIVDRSVDPIKIRYFRWITE